MSRRFRRGLVVGKLAPLHRGHELLIRRALESSDDVVILSYSNPEFAGCGPAERARWLEALFPAARRLVLSGEEGPFRPPANDAPADDPDTLLHGHFSEGLLLSLLHTIGGGTSEIQRDLISTSGLGLPR